MGKYLSSLVKYEMSQSEEKNIEVCPGDVLYATKS